MLARSAAVALHEWFGRPYRPVAARFESTASTTVGVTSRGGRAAITSGSSGDAGPERPGPFADHHPR
jgi:hypothetical protein